MTHQNKVDRLTLHSVENGFCRVYYLEGSRKSHRLLCYQESVGSSFELYECTRDGEPSHTISHQDFINRTPLPEGSTATEKGLRKWLTKQATSDISSQIDHYLALHGGMPTEFDMSVNDLSRDVIRRIDEVYGQCYLVNINLRGKQRGDRNAVATTYQTGDNWNAHNFCADYASPIVTDELRDLVLEWDLSSNHDVLNGIIKHLDDLGAHPLIWA